MRGTPDVAPTRLAGPLLPEQAAALERYIDVLLEALHLSHWQVYISTKPAAEDKNATITPTQDRYTALVDVGPSFFDPARGSVTEHMIHELLHLHHVDVDANVERSIQGNCEVALSWERAVLDQLRRDCEKMVDSLSYVLAPLLPRWDPAAYGWREDR